MHVNAIKTHRIECGESLENILKTYLEDVVDETIVIITSKIVSICQGRVVSKDTISKEDLIKQEADLVIKCDNAYGV